MKTQIQKTADVMDITLEGAKSGGDVIVVGDRIGILFSDGVSGDKRALCLDGIHKLTKVTSDDVAQGDHLFWDVGESKLTLTGGANVYAGRAAKAAGTSDTEVEFMMEPPGYKRAANVAFTAGSNLTAVPGSFADVAAVRTYLITLQGELETRLDALDTGLGAEITALKASGQQASS